jgi:cytochrome c-type biogenesis protein CcmH
MRLHLKNSLLILFVTAFCLAQSPSELVTPEIRRPGDKLACLCKSCKNTVATCQMLGCGYANPARIRIASMQSQGKSDQEIIDAFVKERGIQALAVPPAEGFNLLAWVMPFAALAFGLFAIWLYIKRFRKPAPVPVIEGNDPLGRFRDEIEKDLAKLD